MKGINKYKRFYGTGYQSRMKNELGDNECRRLLVKVKKYILPRWTFSAGRQERVKDGRDDQAVTKGGRTVLIKINVHPVGNLICVQ